MAAAKEAANTATHFLWTQLRGLGSHLEARAWHRRDLTKAELAAKVPITGIHSAPSKAAPLVPAGKKAASAQKPAKQPSKAAQQEGEATPAPAGKKRKRHDPAVHHAGHPGESIPSQDSGKPAKRAALRSHPIEVEEDLPLSPGLQSGSSISMLMDQSAAKTSNGPSSAAHQNGHQGMGTDESLDELAARARLHRHHMLSDSDPGAAAIGEAAPTSNGVARHMRRPMIVAQAIPQADQTLRARGEQSKLMEQLFQQGLSRGTSQHNTLPR